jgi:putative membrane protein
MRIALGQVGRNRGRSLPRNPATLGSEKHWQYWLDQSCLRLPTLPAAPTDACAGEFTTGARPMRYVYMALIAVLVGIVILFKVQNLETATVTFLSMSFSVPVSMLVFLIYVLGMFTGGFMLQLLRTWIRGASASRV